jgi:hypothetical protein
MFRVVYMCVCVYLGICLLPNKFLEIRKHKTKALSLYHYNSWEQNRVGQVIQICTLILGKLGLGAFGEQGGSSDLVDGRSGVRSDWL